MAVREQGAKARLRVGPTSFWKRDVRNSRSLSAAKHGYNALNMRNVFRKIPRKEGDFAEEGQWRRVVELPLQFIVALNLI